MNIVVNLTIKVRIVEQSSNYEHVKEAILKACELVPEAYRQKFRNYLKYDSKTHVEFAREKENLFNRWCHSKYFYYHILNHPFGIYENIKLGLINYALLGLIEHHGVFIDWPLCQLHQTK